LSIVDLAASFVFSLILQSAISIRQPAITASSIADAQGSHGGDRENAECKRLNAEWANAAIADC
jgi:hypothetical protein